MVSVVLVGGGTAGHTSPMIATAEAIHQIDATAQLLCVGTPKGLETTVVPAAGLPLRLIPPVPFPRALNLDLVRLPIRLRQATKQASAILREVGANVVVGFGGYVSLPVYLAARRSHIPVVVQEQNVLPGLANKVAARFAAAVLTSFPDTPLRGAEFTGMPVRRAITELAGRGRAADRDAARRQFGLPESGPVLLVSGGSQGAQTLNDATLGGRERLLKAGVSILHVWGPRNFPEGEVAMEDAGGARYVPVSFVEDMGQAYCAADMMLARSGASTVTETGSIGLPCVFVPFPHGNGEQYRNSASLVEAGAGLLVTDADMTADKLVAVVLPIITDPAKLAAMGQAAVAIMRPGSADRVASVVLKVAA